ncbi:MAG: Hsp20/alpha crystallin family protein [Bdellovibrionales bacterium]|nr:Hsp20/alpha crystallin family protein [Bdellovibrionales bacterium]
MTRVPTRFSYGSSPSSRWTRVPEGIFENFFERAFGDSLAATSSAQGLALDVKEFEDKFVISADVPGVEKEAVDISIEKNVLTLKVTKEEESEESTKNIIRKERWVGTQSRSLVLSEVVDSESISADLKDGVLTIVLPKKPEIQPKKIQIN